MKIIAIFMLFLTSWNIQASEVRVAFADEDFGNWHFCGAEGNHKTKCEDGDEIKGFNPEIAKEIFERLNMLMIVVN